MEQEMSLPVNHDDFIHDITYNFYGTRLATCGSDKCIKIWDWNKQTGLWILNESISAHDSSVVRLSWAHPEFGQVLASCSLDRTVKIWMEHESGAKSSGSRWACVSTLVESSAVVHSIAFAPEYTNLTIAAASSDGKVRFYSPIEAVRLRNWTMSGQIDFIPGGASDSDGPLCLSWCKSRFSAPHMLVVGGSKGNAVKIFQLGSMQCTELLELDHYDSFVLDVSWAPAMGRSFHLIATACSDGHIRIYKFWVDPAMSKLYLSDSLFIREGDDADSGSPDLTNAGDDAGLASAGGDFSVDYDDDEGSDDDSDEDSDEDSDDDDTDSEEDEEDDEEEDEEVNGSDEGEGDGSAASDALGDDVGHSGSDSADAANTAGPGRNRRPNKKAGPKSDNKPADKPNFPRAELVGDLFVEPNMPIRRLRWNSTGTLLVSSGDDGVARMWKMTVNGTWREIAAITAEKSTAEA
ncbi:epoxide hydrolase, soluble (sEH) [Coemansia spiralis]|uniref:Epoxide hydrolase, soluble (SEH) n=2 Tax=Coemansia TaxID=4863 RepID=A0A9W8KYC2_9FUNG|nr:WD40-repeat-containing domain protein [Coemansia spiralis]KAJ1993631.1 epoxide hydrolase, soluble (sEH) [Coemansia umbellata]KAJ2623002.1 epoxide hydrolase, soluble (sEH) [Coemansia sp. RSA 1358]KAJ2679386.1 epoxide hydrolase, soluble (sEH) [Coemansia spiralis]